MNIVERCTKYSVLARKAGVRSADFTRESQSEGGPYGRKDHRRVQPKGRVRQDYEHDETCWRVRPEWPASVRRGHLSAKHRRAVVSTGDGVAAVPRRGDVHGPIEGGVPLQGRPAVG